MKKLYWAIAGTLMLILLGAFVLPYLFYWSVLTESLPTKGLVSQREKNYSLYSPVNFELSQGEILESNWRTFHIGEYLLPVPVLNPEFVVIPTPKYRGKGKSPEFGFRIKDTTMTTRFYFSAQRKKAFKRVLSGSKMFELPIVRDIILKKELKTVWYDLFNINLRIWKGSYKELLYQLYILHLRAHYFPYETESFSYISELGLGVLKVKAKHDAYVHQVFWSFKNGEFSTFQLIYRKGEAADKSFSDHILNKISRIGSSRGDADLLYHEFKVLPFRQKLSPLGITTLYAAWSHWPLNQNFLQEMIWHLERDEHVLFSLNPLYEYVFSQYGSLKDFRKKPSKLHPTLPKISQVDPVIEEASKGPTWEEEQEKYKSITYD